jgi:hypothetical protein
MGDNQNSRPERMLDVGQSRPSGPESSQRPWRLEVFVFEVWNIETWLATRASPFPQRRWPKSTCEHDAHWHAFYLAAGLVAGLANDYSFASANPAGLVIGGVHP